MKEAQKNATQIYKLGWKGVLFQIDSLLYGDQPTSGCIFIPIMIGLFIPRLFLSYLKVSADGLVLHYWPKYQIQVKWQDIDHLGKCRFLGVFTCDALYLKRAEAKKKNAAIRGWGLAHKCLIPLSDFRGWPYGELAESIRKYIPQIFSIQSD